MAAQVAGELYESITGQLFEIGRQLRQPNGYPFNPFLLKIALQNVIEGKFGESSVAVEAQATASPTILAGLLEEVGSPIELATVERFVAREKLVVNTGADAELHISAIGTNLRMNFLGLIEGGVPATALQQRKLKNRSADASILAALGDHHDLKQIVKARIAFAHAFNFLKTADRNCWYIFYIADAKGVVWAVRARWRGDGWDLEARSVSGPREWRVGHHVVSPQILEL